MYIELPLLQLSCEQLHDTMTSAMKNSASPRPNISGKAFQPLSKLDDFQEGVMHYSRSTVLPVQAFTGASTGFTGGTRLPSKLQFQYMSPAGRTFTDLSKWYIRVRARITSDVAGTTALNPADATYGDEQNLQLARFGFLNCIQNSMLTIANRTISNVQDVPQVGALMYMSTKSKSWLESASGQGYQCGPDGVGTSRTVSTVDPGRRIVWDTTVNDLELLVKLPNSLFWDERLVRCGGATFGISCDIRTDWDQQLCVSALADQSASVSAVGANNFLVQILGAELSIPEYEPQLDIPVADMYLAQSAAITLLKEDVTASTSITRTLVTPAEPSKAIVAYQDTAVIGVTCKGQLSNFSQADVNTVQIRWAGQVQPASPYDIDFDTRRYRVPMIDTIMSLGQYSGHGAISGASMEDHEWANKFPIYSFDLVAQPGGKSTNLEVRSTHGAAFTGQLMVGAVSGLWVLFVYTPAGLMAGVEVFESQEDLKAAVA